MTHIKRIDNVLTGQGVEKEPKLADFWAAASRRPGRSFVYKGVSTPLPEIKWREGKIVDGRLVWETPPSIVRRSMPSPTQQPLKKVHSVFPDVTWKCMTPKADPLQPRTVTAPASQVIAQIRNAREWFKSMFGGGEYIPIYHCTVCGADGLGDRPDCPRDGVHCNIVEKE
jgi:hypothetical protein